MKKKDCIVKTSIASLYSDPTFKSELVSQALIWEYLIILDKKNNWYKVKQWDNYISWIHKTYISDSDIYIKKNNLHDYNKWYYLTRTIQNTKNNILLSFGSCVPVINVNKNGCNKILLPDARKIEIKKQYLVKYSRKVSFRNIIKYGLQLRGTPYLWGGKSSIGYDCSGLVQTLLRLNGINFPRDCSNQIKSKKIKKIYKKDTGIGDLIFFRQRNIISHVGIYINKEEFLHSSGEIKINSINSKKSNFSIKLYKIYYGTYRVIG